MGSILTAFSGNPLDRGDDIRDDPTILTERLMRSDSRILLYFEGAVFTFEDNGELLWLFADEVNPATFITVIYLGAMDDKFYYAAEIASPVDLPGKFRDPRSLATKLNAPHDDKGMLGIVAQSKSMLDWHKSHKHCAKCGSESIISKAGYERKCPACEALHYPRTDPVVIMLGLQDGKALVGRGYHYPEGIYSSLAGFMEPGEAIEEAVRREMFEETSVIVGDVRYVASQPWPYPSSIMIGCHADIISGTATADKKEVEEIRWITKDEARLAIAGDNSAGFLLPSSYAIANQLIRSWLEKE